MDKGQLECLFLGHNWGYRVRDGNDIIYEICARCGYKDKLGYYDGLCEAYNFEALKKRREYERT